MSTAVDTAVEGPSFPVATKALAAGAVAAVVGLGWGSREALAGMDLSTDVRMLASLAAAVVLWQLTEILFSRTGISSDAVWQGWLWRSRVPLAEITQVKLLRLPMFDAVVAPRLVVRAGATGHRTFHIADPAVLAVVDVLVHGREVSGGGHG